MDKDDCVFGYFVIGICSASVGVSDVDFAASSYGRVLGEPGLALRSVCAILAPGDRRAAEWAAFRVLGAERLLERSERAAKRWQRLAWAAWALQFLSSASALGVSPAQVRRGLRDIGSGDRALGY